MANVELTTEELRAVIHHLSFAMRRREAGRLDALVEQPGELEAFRKLLLVGAENDVDPYTYS